MGLKGIDHMNINPGDVIGRHEVMIIHETLCPNNAQMHIKDAEQLLAPMANRSMPLLGLKPRK